MTDKNFRKGLAPLILIVIIASSTIVAGGGGYVGVRMYEASKFSSLGDKLSNEGNYGQAEDAYKESLRKWRPQRKVKENLKKVSELKVQKNNFDRGEEALVNKNWQECIDIFSQISSQFPQYSETVAKIEECKNGAAAAIQLAETSSQPASVDQNQATRSGSSQRSSSQASSSQTAAASSQSTNTESASQPAQSSSTPNDTPPVLQNLIIEFGRYDSATGRAGAFLFNADRDKVFLEFGARVTGPDGPKTLPTFEYYTYEGASVYAAADAYVTSVISQPDTGDYEILMSPNSSNSLWVISYDHVKGVTLSVGDRVTVGQTIGTVGTSNGMGRTELSIGKNSGTGSGITSYCPFSLFSSSLINEYKQKVSDLIADWESFKGDTSIYDESRDIYPGCPYETLVE